MSAPAVTSYLVETGLPSADGSVSEWVTRSGYGRIGSARLEVRQLAHRSGRRSRAPYRFARAHPHRDG